MTINEEILAIANQLANEGQQPTIAKVKTKLIHKAPLPQIIAVLKTWQHDPDFTSIKQPSKQNDIAKNDSTHYLDTAIKDAVAPLLTEINALKSQVAHLQAEITQLKLRR